MMTDMLLINNPLNKKNSNDLAKAGLNPASQGGKTCCTIVIVEIIVSVW